METETKYLELIDLLKLEKKGKSYLGLCPFHSEKTGSFTVTLDKNLYYCFGCHKGGDLDNLIESLYSVKSPHVEAYVDDKSVITILKERGLLDSFSSLVAVTKRKGLDCTMTLNRLENDVEYFIYIDDGDRGDSGYIYFRFKNADRHPEAYKIFARGLIGQFQSEPTIIHLGNKN